jgi:4'-phosphopantetheinyl transferase
MHPAQHADWRDIDPRESAPPALRPGAVHVWRVWLDASEHRWRRLLDALPADEQARADAIRSPETRRTFAAARCAVRSILGAYAHVPPRRLPLEYGRRGKPCIANGAGGDAVRFNLSHSGQMALLAASRDGEVGADVEHVRRRKGEARLAARHFSRDERAVYEALEPEERTAFFYHIWCRKEAVIKAWGAGIAFPLSDLCVGGGDARSLIVPPMLPGVHAVEVRSFDAAPEYTSAVAAPPDARLEHFSMRCSALLADPHGWGMT